MTAGTFGLAFGLTLLAGLATGVGGAVAFYAQRTNTRLLAVSLGFSAGVMIYVSLVEILAKARAALASDLGETTAAWATLAAFFGGIALISLIDRFIPSFENPHEPRRLEELAVAENAVRKHHLLRMGLFSALAIAIHNFPEGLATFMAAVRSPALGISIAVAIAIHNIPEGVAVSVPLYYATGSRRRAFGWALLSGLAEPAGALIGFLLLFPFLTATVFGLLFAGVAGIMVFISIDSLLPTAERYGEHHLAIYGVVAGMLVMAVSLAAVA